jgi:hypothetical protein
MLWFQRQPVVIHQPDMHCAIRQGSKNAIREATGSAKVALADQVPHGGVPLKHFRRFALGQVLHHDGGVRTEVLLADRPEQALKLMWPSHCHDYANYAAHDVSLVV